MRSEYCLHAFLTTMNYLSTFLRESKIVGRAARGGRAKRRRRRRRKRRRKRRKKKNKKRKKKKRKKKRTRRSRKRRRTRSRKRRKNKRRRRRSRERRKLEEEEEEVGRSGGISHLLGRISGVYSGIVVKHRLHHIFGAEFFTRQKDFLGEGGRIWPSEPEDLPGPFGKLRGRERERKKHTEYKTFFSRCLLVENARTEMRQLPLLSILYYIQYVPTKTVKIFIVQH